MSDIPTADEIGVPGLYLSGWLDVAPRAQQTPEGLAAFQKAEIDKWWPIIQAAGIGVQAQ